MSELSERMFDALEQKNVELKETNKRTAYLLTGIIVMLFIALGSSLYGNYKLYKDGKKKTCTVHVDQNILDSNDSINNMENENGK